MKLLYIYRHPNLGFSISKVFHPIEKEMKNCADVDSIYLPIPNYSFKGIWKNIKYVQKPQRNTQRPPRGGTSGPRQLLERLPPRLSGALCAASAA